MYQPKSGSLYVGFGDWTAVLQGSGSVGKGDLIKVAQRLSVAPSRTDHSTWFDARTVLPN